MQERKRHRVPGMAGLRKQHKEHPEKNESPRRPSDWQTAATH
ncbi:protein of unknown function (plasmid) [Cupriavidus neocaledonicus]|uniref:Uncharacterized protein n=1 Tax=Cupriavidus neocaledonicus TaxID=1040979 RepID=A0A375HSP5_9BURK|nr:hypothetical protein CBM2605_B80013 [Cupriavidus neocaledonicus]SPD60453.1 protein of unknown function [Cupriavidus neocaledonicus]